MNELLTDSLFFGIALSILTYELGVFLKDKWNIGWFSPLLFSILLVIGILLALQIDYRVYESSAKYLSYLLTPSTVCLAIPLYEQRELVKKYWPAVFGGILSGVLASMGSIFVLSKLFGLTHEQYVTMLPKSITTAIGMGISEEQGGVVTITVAVIIVTGILGNVIAETVFRVFGIRHAIAKGIGLGTSAHATGTAKAMELGKIEGAMGSLSIVVSGLLTVVLISFFVNLI